MTLVPLAAPVEPDGDQGRQWLVDELSKAQYQAAKPTPLDRLAQAISDWIGSLFSSGNGTLGGVVPLVVVIVLVALIVVAFLIFGRPRLNRRSGSSGGIFGADDLRDSRELRKSAAAAASSGDYTVAFEELFRALARDLEERTVVTSTPGTTARAFARSAAIAFPQHSDELLACAAIFDGVRYQDRVGTVDQYQQLTELDRTLQATTPGRLEAVR
jgi:hypothetical protein